MSRTLDFFAATFLLLAPLAPARAADAAPAAGAKDKKPETPAQALGFALKACAGEKNSAKQTKLFSALQETQDQVSRARPEDRDVIVRRAAMEINAAADNTPETSPRVKNALAVLNNATGNYDEAERQSEEVLKNYPADHDALISNAGANFGRKRYPDAFAAADKAVQAYPKDSDAYTSRAMASYGMGHYLQALEDSRRALSLDPNDKTAFALMKLSEGKAPALRPDGIKAELSGEVQREYHGMVQQMNQVEEKRREPSEEPAPRSADKLVRSAASKISIKDYWGALAEADKAVTQDPQNAAAYYYRAAAENLLGRYDGAVADATRALMMNPADTAARDTRAWAFNHLDRYNDAMADANHSLEINPHNAYAFANIAYARERTGDLAGMLQNLKAAAAVNPQFEPAYRDAAARHGLEPETLGSSLGSAAPLHPARRSHSRRNNFVVILVSSLIGGLLIALGFVQLLAPSALKTPKKETLLRSPSRIDQSYAFGRTLGIGGMGVVYEATDRTLNRKVAVKVMREEFKRDAKSKERFLEEARTVAELHHPGIVDIHSVVEDEAGIYMVFEFIEGRTLDEILSEKKRLSLTEAKAILKQVCSALDFAHRHQVVHRDLKPGNIMVTDQGVKIMDFGISRYAAASEKPRMTETAQGTPCYMAPEQEYGAIRRESDLFSLGACLYEMVTGARPYPEPATAERKLTRSYEKPSQLVAGLPPELDALIDGSLHPDPDLRVRTAKDFGALLERIKDGASPKPAA